MLTPWGARLSVGRSPHCQTDASRLTRRARAPFPPRPHGPGGPAAVVANSAATQTAGAGGGAGGPIGRRYILDERWRGATGGRRLRRPGDGGQPWPCNGGRRPRPPRGRLAPAPKRRPLKKLLAPWSAEDPTARSRHSYGRSRGRPPHAQRCSLGTGNSGVCCGGWSQPRPPTSTNPPQWPPTSLPHRRDAIAACRSP